MLLLLEGLITGKMLQCCFANTKSLNVIKMLHGLVITILKVTPDVGEMLSHTLAVKRRKL